METEYTNDLVSFELIEGELLMSINQPVAFLPAGNGDVHILTSYDCMLRGWEETNFVGLTLGNAIDYCRKGEAFCVERFGVLVRAEPTTSEVIFGIGSTDLCVRMSLAEAHTAARSALAAAWAGSGAPLPLAPDGVNQSPNQRLSARADKAGSRTL